MNHQQFHYLSRNKYKPYVFIAVIVVIVSAYFLYNYFQTSQNKKFIAGAEQLMEENPEQALTLLEKVKTGLLDDEQYAWFIIVEARSYDLLHKPIPSDTAVFKARDYFRDKQDAARAALACFVSGKAYINQGGENVLATHNLHLADDWAEKAGYHIPNFPYAKIPYNLALWYSREGDNFSTSNIYARKALQYIEKEKNQIQSHTLEVMGINFRFLNQTDSAEHYFNKALAITDIQQDTASKRRTFDNLAKLYRDTKDFPKAKQYCHQAIEITKTDDKSELGQMYLTLSGIYLKNNQLDSASITANKANDLIADTDKRLKMSVYGNLTNIEEKRGDQQKAEEYQQLYELYKKQRDEENIQMQALANLQKSSFHSLFNREDNNRKLVQGMQQFVYLSGGALALCLFAIIYLLFRVLRVDKIKEDEIDRLVDSKIAVIETELTLQTTEMQEEIQQDTLAYKEQLQEEKEKFKSEIYTYQQQIEKEFEATYKAIRIEIVKSIFQCRDLTNLLEFVDVEFPKDEKTDLLIELIEQMKHKVSWEEMYPLFNIQYSDLFVRIKIDFPMFKEQEYRVCCLMLAEFTNDEIAGILKISIPEVEEIKRSINQSLKLNGFNKFELDDYTKKITDDKINFGLRIN